MPSASPDSLDRRVKWGLLLASLATVALLIYSVLAECVWPQWRMLRAQYAQILKAKATDDRGRALAEQFEATIQQNVLPALHTVDRCITCHPAVDDPRMAGEKQPFRTHPGDFLRLHQPDTYGCTACHAGQGRATEQAAAHGDVEFWPSPMIPARYAYAGCGSCHTHVLVPSQAVLRRGRDAIARYGCLACHTLDGGGVKLPGVAGAAGPDLSQVGATGYDAGWYEKHVARAANADGGNGPSLRPIGEPARADLSRFLASRVGAPSLVEAKALFHSLGCRGCHKVNGVGGKEGPDLSRVGEKDPGRMDFTHVPGEPTLANWLAEHFRRPAAVVPGSQMPVLGLTEEQIDGLTLYMLSLRHSSIPETYQPKDRIRAERFGEREFATDGETLYSTFCAACHGASGQGMRYPGLPVSPAIASPDFLAVAADAFIAHTVQHGRPGRRMPAWGEKEGGLRPQEIQAIVAYLRSMSGLAAPEPDRQPARWVKGDTTAGNSLFATYCASCHGATGQGAEGPALNNTVLLASASDTYLTETIRRGRRGTVMAGFEKPSTVHPALTPSEIESIVSYIRTWETP
ncbi:MAG: hypothetical protein A3K19_06505 [Lentisphaerae bacterium RIFOXYB12_FULL_65_16]|nr:MAG: hypothetical protein A3K18_02135 [Lentisphaerae bacterium RIFOXYA12_64_32]OGV93090.1 MAG: hypothetical protein A3K19_06505 [Lentisphaerae bacterium RIFOXYB12_FULL_65_16]